MKEEEVEIADDVMGRPVRQVVHPSDSDVEEVSMKFAQTPTETGCETVKDAPADKFAAFVEAERKYRACAEGAVAG